MKIGGTFRGFEVTMGSPDAQPEGWHTVAIPEETPHALCQNGPKIARADPPIFGGTFLRLSETRATIYRRNDLWDPGPPVRPANGDRSGAGGADPFEEDRIPVMSPAQKDRLVGEADAGAVSDGGFPDPRVHPFDLGFDRCQQGVRAPDGISGGSSPWE